MVDAKRLERLAARIEVDGRPYSPIAPATAHQSASGYRYWGCRCCSCRFAERDYQSMSRLRKWMNYQLLQRINSPEVVVPSPVTEEQPPPVVLVSPKKQEEVVPPRRPEAPTPGFLPDGQPVPPMTHGARKYVRDVDHLQRIAKAYSEPHIVRPSGQPNSVIHTYDDVDIVILQNTESGGEPLIVAVNDHEKATGEPEVLTLTRPAVPRAKGGGRGRRGPVDQKGLLRQLEDAGVTLRKAGNGHIICERNGKSYSIASTPNGGKRSVANTVANLRRAGILPK